MKLPAEINEGWGITHLKRKKNNLETVEIFISNGSDKIFVIDLETWEIKRTIKVNNESKI